MNYKPGFTFQNQDTPSTNGQTFATKAEALACAEQRFMVWHMPTDYCAVETDEPVNSQWIEGHGAIPWPNTMGELPHVAPAQVRL